MPNSGFGFGPFGQGNFGSFDWSDYILFDLLPEQYKLLDSENGDFHRKFADSFKPSFDRLRHKIESYDDINDPLRVRTQYSETSRIRLGKIIKELGVIEQRGIDGKVTSLREFTAISARFKKTDVGKDLTITRSSVSFNNKKFKIASFINNTTVTTEPAMQIPDAGLFTWEVRSIVEEDTASVQIEVRSGSIDNAAVGWLINDGIHELEVTGKRYFLHSTTDNIILTEREGDDGSVNGSLQFVAPSGNFKQTDIGKPLSITGSTNQSHIVKIEIGKVISSTTIEPTSDFVLAQDTGQLTWAVLPYPIFTAINSGIIRGVVEQEGLDLAITAPNIVNSPTAAFTSQDVGKRLTIRSTTPANNGIFTIATIGPSANQATVTVATLVNEVGPLTWEVRSASFLGDGTQVDVSAPAMIDELAYNFGLTIDKRESDLRQRSWVANQGRWIGAKGATEAYYAVARACGFDAQVSELFRINTDISGGLPASNVFQIEVTGLEGRDNFAEADGFLIPGVLFSSQTAHFVFGDVGSQIELTNTAGGNDGIATVIEVIDIHTIRISKTIPFGTLPDPNSDSITFRIFRTYVDQSPLLPLFDEVNIDLMASIVTPAAFSVDKYCWEPDFNATISITIISVVPNGPNTHKVTASGSINVVVSLGVWKVVDVIANAYFLESIPIDIGAGQFTFIVVGSVAPAIGAGTLSYICQNQLTCDYCASHRLLLKLTTDTIMAESGIQLEDIYARTIQKIEEEVKPAHAEISYWFTTIGEGSLSLEAEVETT